ncbi:SAVED domain-containing protein [Entomomonas asaccharolytica]|uniref:SAVED domain-containing protein n=1 Tax=Entomomonas asaccharolytica TaxID=2785331 RepID=A0A974NGB9_9GAMM|nr:SAVED domain-containing protein [Entomomonas asaccharolytica]QQP86033.1 SAVED domain-containing protein [Entomomonas asaccharolytica]
MCNKILVEAKCSDELFSSLTTWKSCNGSKKLIFIYDPRDNGWRYRIVLFIDSVITNALHGELEPSKRTDKINPLKLLLKIVKQADIESHYCKYANDIWPLTGSEIAIDQMFLENEESTNIETVLSNFAEKRKKILKTFFDKRPKLTSRAINYIFSRSMGCCEFDGCAEPLFMGKEGEYGNYGYLAHIIGASGNGPRSEPLVSNDEIADPQNFLFLCDKHHRLIDKVDPEFYDKHVLRRMLEKRKRQRELLSKILKYEEANSLAILSDIAGIPCGISSDEILKAMLDHKLQPSCITPHQTYIGDIKNGHELLENKADIYWSNFLNTYEHEIKTLHNLFTSDSSNLSRHQKVAIFPLGNIPMLFLTGHIIGESRPITLFHRDRNRDGGTWCWNKAETVTSFSWSHNTGGSQDNYSEVVLTLEITAKLNDKLIPEGIANLPRISITADEPQQNPFGSINDFDSLRIKYQEAINFAQDNLKAEHIHILCIAPAITVFALGQKFQPRNSAQLHIYQTGKDYPYYPVFSFNRQIISMTKNSDIKIEF